MHSLAKILPALILLASFAIAQNCGPQANNRVCAPGFCCSQYSYCGNTAAYCAPGCLEKFSGPGAACYAQEGPHPPVPTKKPKPSPTKTTKKPVQPPPTQSFPSEIPEIDTCGVKNGFKCPGVGPGGYFYRCCSSAGHCGPKNPLQPASIYCGGGCQAGFGQNCDSSKSPPPKPQEAADVGGRGDTCGPIVNRRCGSGLCCSGSNFCGEGAEYCRQGGEEVGGNWCQSSWGRCD
ncbi:chitin binding protein 6 [Pyronema domesticum]|uniref:Similar to Antimicrobial protein PN-AMP1 acc. no. P81591 n=1 Tax=Pyronema omphalodes (strain CBS 100304) TaxID=1076935 RepID=U4KVU0_PYROM|nr:chitin binding protein 6 [Pyronema domesticum]CCX05422.1 Similar to Antimicrobial protein PN-AMP1; acc. no. P81591 [Pyronema omphalodes CBS 100304]